MKHQTTSVTFPLNTLAAAITAVFLSQSVAAQSLVSNIDPDDVNTIVVVGQATSGLDNLITEEELDRLQANDLNGIFRNDPTVSVGGPVGLGQKIHVRDIGEDLLNISVDGAKQSANVFHHTGRISVEPELLKQVEVEAGAGSATAGPGALGGSIRFVTKDPEDLLVDGKNIGALLKGTYSSNGDYFKKSATVYARSENNAVSGMINILDADKNNMSDGDSTELSGTESENNLGFAKIVFNFNENHKLSLSHENVERGGKLSFKPEQIVIDSSALRETESVRKTNILNYNYQPTNNKLIDFSVNLFNTSNELTRFDATETPKGSITSKGATLENTSKLANHKIIYGANYIEDESLYDTSGVTEKSRVWGIYAQDIINVSDKFTITTGLRYDNYRFVDSTGTTHKDDGISPNISANYDVSDNLSFSAGYAQAMQGLTVQDSYLLYNNTTYTYAEGIGAERSTNIEFGINYDIENYSFSAGAYKTSIKDYIDAELPWGKQYTNLDEDLKTKGLFLRGEYHKGSLTLGASVKTSRTTQNNQTITRYEFSSGAVSTGDTLQLSANYNVNNRLKIGWNMEHVNSIDNIDLTFGSSSYTIDKPAYTVHDIYAQWKPTGKDNLKVNFSINNLFDETYLSHASLEDFTEFTYYETISGYNEAGRDVRITLSYQF